MDMDVEGQRGEGRDTICSKKLVTGGLCEGTYQPRSENENSALYVRHTPMPISFDQFALLQTCESTPLVHQLSKEKPRAQRMKSEELRPRLRRGERPWKRCRIMVAVRDTIVRRETARSYRMLVYYLDRTVAFLGMASSAEDWIRVRYGCAGTASSYQDKCPRQAIVFMIQLPQEISHYPSDNDRRNELRTAQDVEGEEGVVGWFRAVFTAGRHLDFDFGVQYRLQQHTIGSRSKI